MLLIKMQRLHMLQHESVMECAGLTGGQTMNPACVIATSTGRTGTKLLAQVFASTPGVEAVHVSSNSILVNVISNLWLCGACPRVFVRLAWKVLKSPYPPNRERVFLDSNNHLYAFVVDFQELIPAVKVLHLVRDPRTYIPSHLNWAHSRPKSYLANFIIPFWQPNPWLCGEVSFFYYIKMSAAERFAWIWQFKNRMLNSLEESGVPYMRVRLEDMAKSTEVQDEISAFLGVDKNNVDWPAGGRKINKSTSSRIPSYSDWPEDWVISMRKWCGPLMTKYGYVESGGEK